MSKKSLLSNLVKLEWQNVILKATNGEVKLIPVKLDDCMMPTLLLQTLYIDMYGKGPDIAVRQMIDVINGTSTFRKEDLQEFENIRGYISNTVNGLSIEFRAEAYMEPQSKFVILLRNSEEEVNCSTQGLTYPTQFVKNWRIGDTIANAFVVSRPNPTSPGFPFQATLRSKKANPIEILGLMRAVSDTDARNIPAIRVN